MEERVSMCYTVVHSICNNVILCGRQIRTTCFTNCLIPPTSVKMPRKNWKYTVRMHSVTYWSIQVFLTSLQACGKKCSILSTSKPCISCCDRHDLWAQAISAAGDVSTDWVAFPSITAASKKILTLNEQNKLLVVPNRSKMHPKNDQNGLLEDPKNPLSSHPERSTW